MSFVKLMLTGLVILVFLVSTACAPAAPPSPTPAPPAPKAAPPAPTVAVASSPTTAPVPSPTVAPAAQAPAPKPSASLTKVRYGLPTSPPVLTTVGVYFALENGFFKEEGLDVEVTPYAGSTTAVRALLSRDADIVMAGPDPAFLARASGGPIKIISTPLVVWTDVVIATKSIGSLKDLTGKRFAISTPQSPAHIAAKILLEKNGADVNKVEFVALGSPADRVRALLAGRVDATALTILIDKPILGEIAAGNVKVLTALAKEFTNLPQGYNLTRDDVVKDRPQILAPFLKAEIKGLRWAQKNPEKAAEIAIKYIKEVDKDLMARGIKGAAELGLYGLDGGLSADGIEKTQKLLIELGTIKQTIKIEEVAVTQFVEQAVKALGPVQ